MYKLGEGVIFVEAPGASREGVSIITRSTRSALTTQPWLSKDDVG